MNEANDGEQLLLLDTDTCLLRPIDDVWDRAFDIAYTTKDNCPLGFPFNLGVFFVRVADGTRALLQSWKAENDRMFRLWFEDPSWRRRFGGVNQAAFGSLLDQGQLSGLNVLHLSCQEWNCEDSAWPTFDPEVTRILHVKDGLRRSVMSRQSTPEPLLPAARAWRSLDREVRRGGRAVAS